VVAPLAEEIVTELRKAHPDPEDPEQRGRDRNACALCKRSKSGRTA
jgi:hypothetical protein